MNKTPPDDSWCDSSGMVPTMHLRWQIWVYDGNEPEPELQQKWVMHKSWGGYVKGDYKEEWRGINTYIAD